ncbi:hypothetical protein DUNSADRAFT_5751 [Dunaliella salina]|uniref:Uncharacterized protein n=1 Tax=Dunaliella salina TaxID=3046 RepID=A0ABQ7H745_DUNSA|nr:hypothetical protein DUNSADRAFT_5751 [Dunaliella salina]|eukprot:KAF5842675.1 hypothetical protein DUNSADRAFT_5751 [Dunaliella salina]
MEQQRSQQQGEKEREHMDKAKQLSDGSAAHAPHHPTSKPQGPKFVPLSSANLAAATAAAKVGYNVDAAHKLHCQRGKLQGLNRFGPYEVAADKQRVWEQQWECASLAPSDTTASSVTLDSISSCRSSSSSSSQGSLRSNGLSLRASSAMGLASPQAKAVLADALKARAEGRQHYASKMHKPHGPGANSTMQYVQSACRFAVKVNGPSLPGNVPNGTVNQLQQRLSRYQRLMPAEAPAVRAGCLVISYGALLQQHSLQDMSKEADAVGKAWAEENGLLAAEESRLTVQACRQSSWCSSHTLPGQPSPLEYSLILHEPFIEASPPNPEQECFCTFDLTLVAPAGFELRGWCGAADAPEDLPDKDRSLSCLASMDGLYVQTSVEQRSLGGLGERLVQVQVMIPPGIFDASSPHPKVLVLELWAAGSLVQSYSAMIVPCLYTGALKEMHNWVDQAGHKKEESSAFMRDLVVWMHYQANNATLTSTGEESQHQLALLAAVGLDLLGRSLQHGMSVLAGLLLIGLMSPPFAHIPSSDTHATSPRAAEQIAAGNSSQALGCAAAPALDASPSKQQPRTEQRGTQTITTTTPAAHQPTTVRPVSQQPGTPGTSIVLCGNLVESAVKAVVGADEASPEEAAYRAWTNAQVARLARMWCMLWVLNIGVGVLRAWTKGRPPLLELTSWGVMLLGYILGALFIRPGCSKTEPILAAVAMGRAAYGTMIGTGLVPISSTLALVFHYRIEAFLEAFMMSVFERVRVKWAVPLRVLLTISVGLINKRNGVMLPFLQSVLVNLCGLGMTAAMEARDRCLYLSSRAHAKQQALAKDDGAGQHAASSSSGKPKSC